MSARRRSRPHSRPHTGGHMPTTPPERPGCPKAPGGRRPLPDPAAIRLYLVPDPAPPYDGDVVAGEVHHGEPRGEGAGVREVGGAARGGPRPAAVPGVPPGWQSRFAQVLAETLAGSRHPNQIVPWTTEQARDHIQRLGPRLVSPQRPRVRRVVTSRPAPDVMEM